MQVGALVIGSDPFFNSHREQLAALTVRHAVPAIYEIREFAAAGGLMSYEQASPMPIASPASTLAEFSRARSPPICRSSKQRKST